MNPDKELDEIVTFINEKLGETGPAEPPDLEVPLEKPWWLWLPKALPIEVVDIAQEDRARRIARIRPPYRCICRRVFETAEQLFDHRCNELGETNGHETVTIRSQFGHNYVIASSWVPRGTKGSHPMTDLQYACRAILLFCPNQYAKAYARVLRDQLLGLTEPELRTEDAIYTQILYVRGNLSGWRTPEGRTVRDTLDRYIERYRPV